MNENPGSWLATKYHEGEDGHESNCLEQLFEVRMVIWVQFCWNLPILLVGYSLPLRTSLNSSLPHLSSQDQSLES